MVVQTRVRPGGGGGPPPPARGGHGRTPNAYFVTRPKTLIGPRPFFETPDRRRSCYRRDTHVIVDFFWTLIRALEVLLLDAMGRFAKCHRYGRYMDKYIFKNIVKLG